VVLLGNHLVSRLDPSADARRRLQASAVRERLGAVRAALPEALVLVAGDLNDEPGSWALEPLLGDADDVDLGARLPASEGWTWSGGGARERLDYVIVPRQTEPAVARVFVASGQDVEEASDHRPLGVDLWLAR
jgi:endonuclease/exonuclease/phosphatase family metal-dependent hydrolase